MRACQLNLVTLINVGGVGTASTDNKYNNTQY